MSFESYVNWTAVTILWLFFGGAGQVPPEFSSILHHVTDAWKG